MILSDSEVLYQMARDYDLLAQEAGRPGIGIQPFDRERLGPNSYDASLGRNLLTYRSGGIDAAREPEVDRWTIPDEGFWLWPGKLYLGVTAEFFSTTAAFVPMIDGTSSCGRLGVSVHVTAGRGDAGFCGHFTLEIWCVEKVKVYPFMPVAQVWWLRVDGPVKRPYGQRPGSNYQEAAFDPDPWPKPSAMWKKIAKQRLAQLRAPCSACGTHCGADCGGSPA